MTTARQQIEELAEAKRKLTRRLEELRAEHHEAGAKINDQLTQLQKGDRRP